MVDLGRPIYRKPAGCEALAACVSAFVLPLYPTFEMYFITPYLPGVIPESSWCAPRALQHFNANEGMYVARVVPYLSGLRPYTLNSSGYEWLRK